MSPLCRNGPLRIFIAGLTSCWNMIGWQNTVSKIRVNIILLFAKIHSDFLVVTWCGERKGPSKNWTFKTHSGLQQVPNFTSSRYPFLHNSSPSIFFFVFFGFINCTCASLYTYESISRNKVYKCKHMHGYINLN